MYRYMTLWGHKYMYEMVSWKVYDIALTHTHKRTYTKVTCGTTPIKARTEACVSVRTSRLWGVLCFVLFHGGLRFVCVYVLWLAVVDGCIQCWGR